MLRRSPHSKAVSRDASPGSEQLREKKDCMANNTVMDDT